MTATLKQVINSLQTPISDSSQTMAEQMQALRAKALQQLLETEPANSTPESTGDGDVTAKLVFSQQLNKGA